MLTALSNMKVTSLALIHCGPETRGSQHIITQSSTIHHTAVLIIFTVIIQTRVEVIRYGPVCHTGTSLLSYRPGWKWAGMSYWYFTVIIQTREEVGWDVILVLNCHHTYHGGSWTVCHTRTSLLSYRPGWKWAGMSYWYFTVIIQTRVEVGWDVILVPHCYHTYQGGSWMVWAGMSYRYFTVIIQTRVEVGQ